MKRARIGIMASLSLSANLFLSGCMVPAGPVSVTRFHLPETVAHGSIAVVPAPGENGLNAGMPGDDAWSWQDAVARQLATLGYTAGAPDSADQIAQVRLIRQSVAAPDQGPRTQVSFGGGASNYGSGAGVGIGFRLGGRPVGQTATDLSVVIRERATGKVLWEGRASLTVAANAPLAQTTLAAPKLAAALFTGFPGTSGQTIQVP